jgi:hypothetical protein
VRHLRRWPNAVGGWVRRARCPDRRLTFGVAPASLVSGGFRINLRHDDPGLQSAQAVTVFVVTAMLLSPAFCRASRAWTTSAFYLIAAIHAGAERSVAACSTNGFP